MMGTRVLSLFRRRALSPDDSKTKFAKDRIVFEKTQQKAEKMRETLQKLYKRQPDNLVDGYSYETSYCVDVVHSIINEARSPKVSYLYNRYPDLTTELRETMQLMREQIKYMKTTKLSSIAYTRRRVEVYFAHRAARRQQQLRWAHHPF